MGEIKSAWEIAREKAEKLGELSAEELKKQKEERGNSIGKALAEKFLGNPDSVGLLQAVDNHKGEEREIIRRAALIRLVEAIELGRDDRLKEVSQGISGLFDGGKVVPVLKEIGELFGEYGQAEQAVRQRIESAGREILHQLRISGTAVGEINPQVKEEWQRSLDEFAQPFEERLQGLKQALLEQLNLC